MTEYTTEQVRGEILATLRGRYPARVPAQRLFEAVAAQFSGLTWSELAGHLAALKARGSIHCVVVDGVTDAARLLWSAGNRGNGEVHEKQTENMTRSRTRPVQGEPDLLDHDPLRRGR